MDDATRVILDRIGVDGPWEDRSDGLWRAEAPFSWYYVLIDGQAYTRAPVSRGWDDSEWPEVEAAIRRALTAEIAYSRLPDCVAPGCGERAPMEFKAAAHGRLAGQDWHYGDLLRFCPQHGHDVMAAQGQGRDELPDWLKADARPSALDELDAAMDTLTLPPDWLDRQARIMRLAQRMEA